MSIHSSPRTTTMASSNEEVDFAWAQSLVGRDWEIFWEEQEENSDQQEAEEKHGSSQELYSALHCSESMLTQEATQWWGCDVCQKRFPHYNEACRHEVQCLRMQHQGVYAAAARAAVNPKETIHPQLNVNIGPTTDGTAMNAADVANPASQQEKRVLAAAAGAQTSQSEPKQQAADEDAEMNGDEDADEDYSEEEDVEDVTDWYDATVIGFDNETGIFRVNFVGDDDTVYKMKLKPSIVRPCIRAWVKRSKAILEGHFKGEQFVVSSWEKQLPADTATLEDRKLLDHQWKGALEHLSRTGAASSTVDSSLAKDRQDIVHLCYLVQSQVYLRSKLAPVVPSGPGETGVAVSDAYLDHLVKCLKELQELCVWYEDCYSLHSNVFSSANTANGAPRSQQSRDIPMYAPGGSLFNIEYLRGYCLEKGRAMINSLLAMDFSRAGAKRRPVVIPLTSTARNTKRRKGYKASGFLESGENKGDDVFFLEEGEFMSVKSVCKFVNKVEKEAWYVGPLARMLRQLCSDVQEPVRIWKRHVDEILGVECEWEDDDSSEDEDMDRGDPEEAAKQNQGDEPSTDDEGERYFTFEEIDSLLGHVKHDRVLKKFDLSQWTNKLREKLTGIESFEADVWILIPHIVDEVGESMKDSDDVLANLRQVKEAAESTNEHVKNVNPIGRESSRLTRTVIENAIAVREWILDLRHADVVRERLSFVQDVVSRAPMLPHVPSPPHRLVDESLTSGMASRLGQAMSHIQKLSSKLYSHVQVFSRYEIMVAENDSMQLRSKAEVRAAVEELRATPVISLIEEKLSIRLDVLNWRDSVQGPLDSMRRGSLKFELLDGLKKQLDAIVSGQSSSRAEILKRVEKNGAVDNAIRLFARNEIHQFCAEEAATIEDLYSKARDWKDRADAIILALRIHGNPTAGSSLSTANRSAAMVDLKRIDDLLSEYGELGSTMDERRTRLSSVHDEALSWCSTIDRIIAEDTNVLERLTVTRDTRPKGVFMDPARHVVDSWVEILEWHDRVVGTFRDLCSSAMPNAGTSNDAAGETLSSLIADKVYPLMLEGQEVIALYSHQQSVQGDTPFSASDALAMLSRYQESNKPLRTISTAKFETSQLGNMILSRIIDDSRDASEGSPLRCLLFLAWRVAVIDLLRRQSAPEEVATDTAVRRPTLEEAKRLNDLRPLLPLVSTYNTASGKPFTCLFSTIETTEVAAFRKLISDGERVEATTRSILSATKEVVRGSFDKKDEVSDHLAMLKQLQASFKSPVQEHSGLILSSILEQNLDNVTKDVSWLVKTFPYASLHSDTLPEQNDDDYHNMSEQSQSSAIPVPWDVLVQLHDRLPDPITGPGGDIARVSLRVEELFDAAKAWQDEVTNQMSLSFRGGAKRRVPIAGASEPEEAPKIDMGRLAQLAKHPILARVSMPREAAVCHVLDRARVFEESLAGLLNADFEDSLADKTPYPESDSLVGKNGDFLLYRLTGSPLFEALKAKLADMSEIAVDVLADTQGKGAFDWIVKAVAWIEELKKSVDDTSSCKGSGTDKLVIPSSDAKRLLDQGNGLFLEFTDDLRRTLAAHKISLSTNKQTERLTVVIGKGGAMHSLGGTAIKWCPLLLEWLRADVERLQEWETKVISTCKAFQAMVLKDSKSSRYDRETVYRWFQFRENVALLLDEVCDSLVITPQRSMMTKVMTLKSELDKWAAQTLSESRTTLGMDSKALLRSRFEEGGPAVEERYNLLDALLKRRELDEEVTERKGMKTPKEPIIVPPGPTARDKARSILERALRKGMQMMGIDEAEATLFCALKASEIEQALFAAYRQRIGSRSVTDEYRSKLRSLRYNMEDTKNPTLCPRILVGEIAVSQLVNMTSEDLASEKVKLKKAKAEEESKKNIILNPGAAKPKEEKQPQTVKGLLQSSLKSAAKASNVARKPVLKIAQPSGASPNLTRQVASFPPLLSTSPSPQQERHTLKIASQLPPPPLDVKTSRQEAAALLPTPPSLALTTPPSLAMASPPPAPTSRFLLNSNGTDQFTISVSERKKVFKAKFTLIDESQRSLVDLALPELLAEKGRSPVDVCSKFLKEKLETGRWTAISLRLTTVSDGSSADTYKRYCKEYEKRARISMLSVGKDTNLFLVIPKFHSAAKPLKFENRSSTYAVFLVRSRRFS